MFTSLPIPVAARTKASVCGRSLAGIVGSNPTGGMHVCLLWVLCVVRSLRRADHLSRGVLPSVVCLKCDREASIMRSPWPTRGCCAMGKKNIVLHILRVSALIEPSSGSYNSRDCTWYMSILSVWDRHVFVDAEECCNIIINTILTILYNFMFHTQSNSVITSWKGLNILCRYKRVLL